MMLPTHALAGMLLAAPLVVVAPELASVGFVAGFLGGVIPDLDMYVGHRRTLHYPVYYSAVAVPALFVALAVPSVATVGVAFVLLGAALHSVADAYGGGLELRPWEGNSDRAVYDHYHERWVAPRRGVRYDGAVEDLAIAVGLSIPLFALVGDGRLRLVVAGTLIVAVAYTVLRRRLAEIAATLVSALPDAVDPYLPKRYR